MRQSAARTRLRSTVTLRIINSTSVRVAMELGTGLNWDYILTGATSATAMVPPFARFRSLCTKQTLKSFMRYE